MASGLYPRFIRRLTTVWRARHPGLRPVESALAPGLSKSSTFYAGAANRHARHLFINLQHNPKAWKAGQFTVNAVFSPVPGAPARWHTGTPLEDGPEGMYRVGTIVHGYDKWWCLQLPEKPHRHHWVAASYDDEELVFLEAIEDVSRDLEALFAKIGQT